MTDVFCTECGWQGDFEEARNMVPSSDGSWENVQTCPSCHCCDCVEFMDDVISEL